MSLNDDWKAEKLKYKHFYHCKHKTSGELQICIWNGEDLYSPALCGNLIHEFWDIIRECEYEELKKEYKLMSSYEEKKLEALQAEADKWAYKCGQAEGRIYNLCQLLKKCKEVFEEIRSSRGIYFSNIQLEDIIAEIKEVCND